MENVRTNVLSMSHLLCITSNFYRYEDLFLCGMMDQSLSFIDTMKYSLQEVTILMDSKDT